MSVTAQLAPEVASVMAFGRRARWLTLSLVALLVTLLVSACASCPPVLTQLEPVTLQGSNAMPSIIRIFNPQGEVVASWLGTAHPRGWTSETETLIFLGDTKYGLRLIVGDPVDGTTYLLTQHHPNQSRRRSDRTDTLDLINGDQTRQIRMPGPLIYSTETNGFPSAGGNLTVKDGQVWQGRLALLPDQGLSHTVLESPSGRWVAAIEYQSAGSYLEYALEIGNGSSLPRVAADLARTKRRELQPPSPISPDGTRIASVEPRVVSLAYRADPGIRWWHPIGGDPDVWWSPDSKHFAFFSWDDRLITSDLKGNVGVAIHAIQRHYFLGWNGNELRWQIVYDSDY